MPRSRPMPSIGRNCRKLKTINGISTWSVVCQIDDDAIVIAALFPKKFAQTLALNEGLGVPDDQGP